MITEALLVFGARVVRAMVGLIPSWGPETEPFTTTSANVGAMAAVGNGYFPLTVLGVCLAVIVVLKVGLLVWRLIVFVYELFPFKMT